MLELNRKNSSVQFYTFFNWGYYFNAGCLYCKKIKLILSNEV